MLAVFGYNEVMKLFLLCLLFFKQNLALRKVQDDISHINDVKNQKVQT